VHESQLVHQIQSIIQRSVRIQAGNRQLVSCGFATPSLRALLSLAVSRAVAHRWRVPRAVGRFTRSLSPDYDS